MQKPTYESSTCFICGTIYHGRFAEPWHYCQKHCMDEIGFHQALQAGPLSKDQRAQKRLYEKRWK